MFLDDSRFVDEALDYLYFSSSESFQNLMDAKMVGLDFTSKEEVKVMCTFRIFETAFMKSNLATNIACLTNAASKGFKRLVSRQYESDEYILLLSPNNGMNTNINARYFLQSRRSTSMYSSICSTRTLTEHVFFPCASRTCFNLIVYSTVLSTLLGSGKTSCRNRRCCKT